MSDNAIDSENVSKPAPDTAKPKAPTARVLIFYEKLGHILLDKATRVRAR